MTANLIKGKGFRGALRYNLGKVARNVAEVLDSTFARSTEQGILKEVQMVRSLRPRLEKYFYHTSINFPPEENISSDLMRRLGREYLEAGGFVQHQFIMFRHFDASHPHLHILVNRIGYDGKVMSDSNDFRRTEDILRNLEIKYGLKQVIPSREARHRAVTKNETEFMKRTGEPSKKVRLQRILSAAFAGKPDLDTFIYRLRQQGVRPIFNQATTGHVSGISYELGDFRTTGGALGSDYKWASVRKQVGYDPARDNEIIKRNNDDVRRAGELNLSTSSSSVATADDATSLQSDFRLPDFLSSIINPETSPPGEDLNDAKRRKKRKKRRR